MSDWLPRPEPPAWAVRAGLPEPFPDDGFCEYVEGLGLDCDELTRDLTSRTAALANVRLGSRIAKDMPHVWSEYVRQRLIDAHPEDDLAKVDREQDRLARLLFAERYQPTQALKELYGIRK